MCRFGFRACGAVLLGAIAGLAGPHIHFDTKVYDCGTLTEGKTETLHAVFVVKNTGDSVLKITEVRPGCGCTVVKFDSIVQPGQTTRLLSDVNIKGYRSGPVSKSVTVRSNAQNEPVTVLTIRAVIQSAIDVSESYLAFAPGEGGAAKTLYLASKKSDLKVTGVSFVPDREPGGLAWRSGPAPSVTYQWFRTDSTRADGCRVYRLVITSPYVEETVSGEFLIKTNHPDKAEFGLRGSIRK